MADGLHNFLGLVDELYLSLSGWIANELPIWFLCVHTMTCFCLPKNK